MIEHRNFEKRSSTWQIVLKIWKRKFAVAFQLDTSEQGYPRPFLAGWVWVVSFPRQQDFKYCKISMNSAKPWVRSRSLWLFARKNYNCTFYLNTKTWQKSPDPPSPRVILKAIHAGVGKVCGTRLGSRGVAFSMHPEEYPPRKDYEWIACKSLYSTTWLY